MDESIEVHARVAKRHPDITKEDVLHGWVNAIRYVQRRRSALDEFIAVGPDESGRMIEMVAEFRGEHGWLIYHAMRPPSQSTLKELGLSY